MLRSSRRFFMGGLGASGFSLGSARAQSVREERSVWRIQSSWGENTKGFMVFKEFCDSVIESTKGALSLVAVPAGAVRNDLQLYDALKIGAIEGINTFSIYWAGKVPAGVFMSSFPGGISYPSHWDMMLDVYGGRQLLEKIYDNLGMKFVDYIHHDINILHTRSPVRNLRDFKGLRLRLPGNLIGASFRLLGSRPVLLSGDMIVSAIEGGTLDGADFVGAAVNFRQGIHKFAPFVVMGPSSSPGITQPSDIMDMAISKNVWDEVKPSIQELFKELVSAYSRKHYVEIQIANREAWKQMFEAGVKVERLSEDDMKSFRKKLLPVWFSLARKDEYSKKLLEAHINVMLRPEVNLLSTSDVEGYSI